MAKQISVTIIDDLDGSEGAETRSFTIGTTVYTIDLNTKNWTKLLKTLEPYTSVATVEKKQRAARSSSSRTDTTAVREWAKENGVEVSDRGRIPASVLEQYKASLSA